MGWYYDLGEATMGQGSIERMLSCLPVRKILISACSNPGPRLVVDRKRRGLCGNDRLCNTVN